MSDLQSDGLSLFLNYTDPDLDSRIFEFHDSLCRQIVLWLFILISIVIIPYACLKLPRFRAAYIVLLTLACIHSIFATLLTASVFEPTAQNQTNVEVSFVGIEFLLNRGHAQFYIRIFAPFLHWKVTFLLTFVYIFFVDTRRPQSDRMKMFQDKDKWRYLLLLFIILTIFLLTSLLVYLACNYYIETLFGQFVAACILLFYVRRSASKWSKHFRRYETTEYKKSKNRISATLNFYFCGTMGFCTVFLIPIPKAAFAIWAAYELAQWYTTLLQIIVIWIYVVCYSRITLPLFVRPLKAQGDPGVPITDLKAIYTTPPPNVNIVLTFLEMREQMSHSKRTELGNKPAKALEKQNVDASVAKKNHVDLLEL